MARKIKPPKIKYMQVKKPDQTLMDAGFNFIFELVMEAEKKKRGATKK